MCNGIAEYISVKFHKGPVVCKNDHLDLRWKDTKQKQTGNLELQEEAGLISLLGPVTM